MKRIDPLTSEEFIPKKKSQKFASPTNRIKYNNQKANELRENRAYIEKPLNKNHKILIDIMGNEKKKVLNRHFLLGKDFDFSVFNHYQMIDNISYPSVYEFCIISQKGNDNLTIQKI